MWDLWCIVDGKKLSDSWGGNFLGGPCWCVWCSRKGARSGDGILGSQQPFQICNDVLVNACCLVRARFCATGISQLFPICHYSLLTIWCSVLHAYVPWIPVKMLILPLWWLTFNFEYVREINLICLCRISLSYLFVGYASQLDFL